MDRVTIEDARAAYAATGLRPMPGMWCDRATGCACPLGALVAARYGRGRASSLIDMDDATALLGLPGWYSLGYVEGFDDGAARWRYKFPDGSPYLTGYADGRAAHAALLGDDAC